jgi:HD-like signal output (HDOD) protein
MSGKVAVERDALVGADPTWEALPVHERMRWLEEIEDFPPPPLLLELLNEDLRLETYEPLALSRKLSRDTVLTGRILGRANCAAIAPRKAITSMRQAIVHLGFNLVRTTVLRYQMEQSALKLEGAVRSHILGIQRSTDQGAIIAFNWAALLGLPDPASIATRCLLARLGSFLLARRYPERMPEYFAAGSEPQRLNFEANNFSVTTRSLTYKVAQAWGLPESMQLELFHLWTPLFSDVPGCATCVASASLALSFDPPEHLKDLQGWLSLLAHERLKRNLQACGALEKLPNLLESETYRREMASVEE